MHFLFSKNSLQNQNSSPHICQLKVIDNFRQRTKSTAKFYSIIQACVLHTLSYRYLQYRLHIQYIFLINTPPYPSLVCLVTKGLCHCFRWSPTSPLCCSCRVALLCKSCNEVVKYQDTRPKSQARDTAAVFGIDTNCFCLVREGGEEEQEAPV